MGEAGGIYASPKCAFELQLKYFLLPFLLIFYIMIIVISMIILAGRKYMNISAVKARKRFGELLNRVMLTDEEITIERSGKEVAKLTKVGASAKNNRKQGKLDFRKSRGLGKEIWMGVNIEEYIKKERSEWS